MDLGGGIGDPGLNRLLLGERPAERLALERVACTSARTPAASGRASASRGGSGPGRAASARSGSRRPARRARSRAGRERPCSEPRSACSSLAPHGRARARRRTTSTPGVSAGTMICDARRCGSASGSVTAITIPKAAPSAPDENHLCPSITHSSPVPDGARPQQRRVGAGHLRLGHREERAHLARDERREEALLLLGRAEEVQDLGVARVRAPGSRRRAAPRPSGRSPRSGARRRGSPAGAAGLGRHVRRPEPLGLRPRAQVGEQRVGLVVLPVEHRARPGRRARRGRPGSGRGGRPGRRAAVRRWRSPG